METPLRCCEHCKTHKLVLPTEPPQCLMQPRATDGACSQSVLQSRFHSLFMHKILLNLLPVVPAQHGQGK